MADSTDMPERSRAPAGADGHSEVCVTHPPGAGVQAATSENNGFDASDDPQALPIEGAEADTVRENPSERSPGLRSQAVAPACSCGSDVCSCGGRSSIEFVYALGQLGFDFGTEARRDSIAQHMEGSPGDPSQLLAYLEENPWDGDSIIWTFNFDATAIYAIQPQGAFAREGYERLRRFLKEQLTEGVERVSAAGVIAGKVRLMSGQVVPIVRPDLRCMYSWTTAALVEAVVGKDPAKTAKDEEKRDHTRRRQSVTNFLERVYHELRNLGLTPRERAINWAATNAFNVNRIFEAALKENMELDAIEVERSPVCRPDSDCWDVKLLFFDPENVLRSRKAYRFTVDVSDVCPVTVGGVRSWSVR